MLLKLWTCSAPSGRCLLLAEKLARVTDERTAIVTAQRLFAGTYSAEKPATIRVDETEHIEDVKIICEDIGVEVEVSKE